jgi:ferric-dicitrate binding protein FerR (iron transport regulator)
LQYPTRFKSRERRIILTGEAYFIVKTDPSKKFVVEIQDFEITALGTKFNISAYPEDNISEIVLESGKVVIDHKVIGDQSGTFLELQPGQKFTYQASTNSKDITKVDIHDYIAWTEGKLVFRDEPMEKLVMRIGRWYNVQIILGNEELKSYQFRGSVENESLNEVLDILKQTSPIKYVELKREALPDGSPAPRKITILLDS